MTNKKKTILIVSVFFLLTVLYKCIVSNIDFSFATYYQSKADVTASEEEIVCQKDGIISDELCKIAETELNKIPTSFKEEFLKSGWHIYITDENLAKEYFNGEHTKVHGCTFYEKRLILIENNENAVKTATIHEFGHWADNYYGNISKTQEFKNIYKQEYLEFEQVFLRDCKMDITEYFAEGFYYYVKNPDALKKIAPKTYLVYENLEKTEN